MKHETKPTPEDSEPLPCPFCGEGGVSLTVDSDIGAVVCDGCTATGPSMLRKSDFATEEEMDAAAIGAWNFRVSLIVTRRNRVAEICMDPDAVARNAEAVRRKART